MEKRFSFLNVILLKYRQVENNTFTDYNAPSSRKLQTSENMWVSMTKITIESCYQGFEKRAYPKKIFVKSPVGTGSFKCKSPDTSISPAPVVTRRRTRFDAVMHCTKENKNLEIFCSVANGLVRDDVSSVAKLQDILRLAKTEVAKY